MQFAALKSAEDFVQGICPLRGRCPLENHWIEGSSFVAGNKIPGTSSAEMLYALGFSASSALRTRRGPYHQGWSPPIPQSPYPERFETWEMSPKIERQNVFSWYWSMLDCCLSPATSGFNVAWKTLAQSKRNNVSQVSFRLFWLVTPFVGRGQNRRRAD